MAKKTMHITESELTEIINEQINKIIEEGIDIDIPSKTVGFNPNHQKYVDTNDPWNPHPFYNEVRGYKVISIFERKQTDDRQDGNPLIWALKGKDWKFRDEHYDLMALLRRFVSVTKELNESFDVIITTPSQNKLNNEILKRISRIIPHSISIENFFMKYEANWVYEQLLDSKWMEANYPSEKERSDLRNRIYSFILRMNKENEGIFSYKYIPKPLREVIIQSMYVSDEYKDNLELANEINDKRVLVLDDTVTSGKTISDSANALLDTFAPKDITFLTLFTPLIQK